MMKKYENSTIYSYQEIEIATGLLLKEINYTNNTIDGTVLYTANNSTIQNYQPCDLVRMDTTTQIIITTESELPLFFALTPLILVSIYRRQKY